MKVWIYSMIYFVYLLMRLNGYTTVMLYCMDRHSEVVEL